MDQTALANQTILGHQRERSEDPNLVRHCHLCFDPIIKKELKLDASLYTCLQILSVSIFEKTEIHAPCSIPSYP